MINEFLGGNSVKRCLIVDDSKFWRMILQSFLEKIKDVEIYTAENVIEAVNMALRVKPDVVITDYNMPGLSGLQLCMYLRSIKGFEKVGVAVLTGSDDVLNVFWATKSGADRFISKMLKKEKLEEEILQFIQNPNFVYSESSVGITVQDIYSILEAKMRTEILNREILRLVNFVRDEGFVIRKLRDLFLNFSAFLGMYTLILSPVEGRIYSFGKRPNSNKLKDLLLGVLEKPLEPSMWVFYPSNHSEHEISNDLIIAKITYEKNEIGVIAFEHVSEVISMKMILEEASESLGVLFNTLNVIKELRIESTTDGLTGLLNKKALLNVLDKVHRNSKQAEKTYALAVFDIDNFKKVNDTYGHLVGDEVLKSVARILKENLQSDCFIGRYGGEEFVAVFPNADTEKIKENIENLLQTVRTTEFPTIKKCTISCGVAIGENKQSALETLQEADQYLYLSKKTGKDRAKFNFVGEHLIELAGSDVLQQI